MTNNAIQPRQLKETTLLSERAFWVAIHRVILSLAAIIKRYKIDILIDD